MANLCGLEFIDRASVYSCIWLTICVECILFEYVFVGLCVCVHENGTVVNGEIIIPL